MSRTVRYALGASVAVLLTVGSAASAGAAASGVFGSTHHPGVGEVQRDPGVRRELAVGDVARRQVRRLRLRRARTSCRATPTAGRTSSSATASPGPTTRVSVAAGGGAGQRAQRPAVDLARRPLHRLLLRGDATSCRATPTARPTSSSATRVAGTTRRVSVASGGGAGQRRQRLPLDLRQRPADRLQLRRVEPRQRRRQRRRTTSSSATWRAGTTRRVSVSSTGAGGNGPSALPGDLGQRRRRRVRLRRDEPRPRRHQRQSRRVRPRPEHRTPPSSCRSEPGGEPADSLSAEPALSRDGRYVAFDSSASEPRPRRHQRLPGRLRPRPHRRHHPARVRVAQRHAQQQAEHGARHLGERAGRRVHLAAQRRRSA